MSGVLVDVAVHGLAYAVAHDFFRGRRFLRENPVHDGNAHLIGAAALGFRSAGHGLHELLEIRFEGLVHSLYMAVAHAGCFGLGKNPVHIHETDVILVRGLGKAAAPAETQSQRH